MSKSINNAHQVNALRKVLLSKKLYANSYNILVGVKTKDEFGKTQKRNIITVQRVPENATLRLAKDGMIDIDKKDRVVLHNKTTKKVENFTTSMISVRLFDMDQVNMYLGKLYVHFNGSKTHLYVASGEHDIIDVLTGDVNGIGKVRDAQGNLKRGVHLYIPYKTSPAKIRKQQIDYIDISNGVDSAEVLLDALTSHGYSLFKGKEMDQAKAAKAFARVSQSDAPSVEIGQLHSYAIYMGKFEYEGDDAWDGAIFYSNKFFARCFSARLGVAISEEAVNGLAAQGRGIGYFIKCFGRGHNDAFMKTLMNRFDVVRVSEMTDEINDKLIHEDPEFAGKLVVIGDAQIPDLIVDLNGLKAHSDYRLEKSFSVLDIAKESPANTSGQMLQKCVFNKESLLKLLGELFVEDYEARFGAFTNNEVKIPSLIDMQQGKFFMPGLISDIAPEYAKADKKIFMDNMENLLTGAMNCYNRLRYRIDGSFSRLMSDIAPLLCGQRVLKYGEVFMPHATKYFKKNGNEPVVTLIKYPSIGTGEFYQARVVDIDEVISRVGKLDADIQTRRVIIEWFRSTWNSCVIVPCVPLLKKQLAGMDFDYDGCTVIYDVRFNSIIKGAQPQIVSIISPKGNKEKIGRFSVALFPEILKRQFTAGSKSIGEITVMDDVIIALMSSDVKVAAEVLSRTFGNEGGEAEYKTPLFYRAKRLDGIRVPYVEINQDKMNKILAGVKSCKLDENSVPQILKDLNVVFRFLQETTIDAAKTGIAVPIDFNVLEVAIPELRKKMVAACNWKALKLDVK